MKQWRRVLFLMSVTLFVAIGDMEFESDGDDSVGLAYAEEQDRDSTYIAPFVPTPQEVVDRMLELAQVSQRDLLYDLGSGDGRIVITAARRYGAQAVGFEIDSALVTHSKRNIKEAGVEALAEIRDQERPHRGPIACQCGDNVSVSRSQPTPESRDQRQLKPGSRVVSHDFSMGDWKPDRVERMTDSAGSCERSIFGALEIRAR